MAQPSPAPKRFACLLATLASAAALVGGCSTSSYRGYYLSRPQVHEPSDAIIPLQPAPPRTLAMFEGDSGRVATWADLMEGVAWAEVIFLGEVHDHLEGHQVQTAIVEDTIASFPGSAVSMEMFERNDQATVDRYLRGEIDVTTLVTETKSLGWGMSPSQEDITEAERRAIWDAAYQPTVDAAKRAGSRVIAANAPRDYVRKARSEGYDALRALPESERALFDVPSRVESGRYREQFNEVMLRDGESLSDQAVRERIDNTYRSQQVWDTTMGRSIANALLGENPPPKIVHLVGGFHVDYRVGTVTRLLEARPGTRVLTIQVVPVDARTLRDEDRGRADLIIYAARAEVPEEAPKDTSGEAAGDMPTTAPETTTPPAAGSTTHEE